MSSRVTLRGIAPSSFTMNRKQMSSVSWTCVHLLLLMFVSNLTDRSTVLSDPLGDIQDAFIQRHKLSPGRNFQHHTGPAVLVSRFVTGTTVGVRSPRIMQHTPIENNFSHLTCGSCLCTTQLNARVKRSEKHQCRTVEAAIYLLHVPIVWPKYGFDRQTSSRPINRSAASRCMRTLHAHIRTTLEVAARANNVEMFFDVARTLPFC